MTVIEFLLKKTQINELCVIRYSGWIVATAWIDNEDLFRINKEVANGEFKSDEWGELEITTKSGDQIHIPCHYIDYN